MSNKGTIANPGIKPIHCVYLFIWIHLICQINSIFKTKLKFKHSHSFLLHYENNQNLDYNELCNEYSACRRQLGVNLPRD